MGLVYIFRRDTCKAEVREVLSIVLIIISRVMYLVNLYGSACKRPPRVFEYGEGYKRQPPAASPSP